MIELRTRRGRIAAQLAVVALTLPFALPLAAVVMGANRGGGLVANLQVVLSRPELPGFFVSSSVIAAVTVLTSTTAALAAGYALARLRHRGKRIAQGLLVACLTLPSVSLVVPLIYIVSTAGLFDTYAAVAVPLIALTIPFNAILARSFIAELPDEMFEAADIDGASTWQKFVFLVVPLSRPMIAVVLVWTFVAAWNEFLLPLIFLQDVTRSTITLLPQFFTSQYATDQAKVITASLVALVPTVVIFLLTQRVFERGITSGALK